MQEINVGFEDEITDGSNKVDKTIGISTKKLFIFIGLLAIFGFAIFSSIYFLPTIIYKKPSIFPEKTLNPFRPLKDNRLFKYLELENKMKVLLINNPDVKIASVGVAVQAGSYQEPNNLNGLAHFLEHLLFTGSKKYPEVNKFSSLIAKYAGNYNAMTGSEHTVYFFNISDIGLSETIDVLAHFFIDPLLLNDSVFKEINAVDSEQQFSLSKLEWKVDYLIQLLANKSHPFSRFSIGNKEILVNYTKNNNISLINELRNFFNKYYTANIMSLVIEANKSLENLEKMAKTHFSAIKNNNISKEILMQNSSLESILQTGTFSKMVYPNSDKVLYIVFLIDELKTSYKTNPLAFLEYFMLDHQKDGWISYLKKEGFLLTTTKLEGIESTSQFVSFYLGLTLTDLGLKNTDKILSVFQAQLKGIEKKITKQNYDEIAKIAKAKFLISGTKIEIIDLAIKLNFVPLDDIFSFEHLLEKQNKTLIQNLLNRMLNPKNSIIVFSSNNFTGKNIKEKRWRSSEEFFNNPSCFQFDNLTKVNYSLALMDPAWQRKLLVSSLPKSIKYPILPNPYVPTSWELVPTCKSSKSISFCAKQEISQDKYRLPKLLFNSTNYTIWHKLDRSLSLPLTSVYLQFIFPFDFLNADKQTIMVCYGNQINEYIDELFDTALRLGYKFELDFNEKGILMKFIGFSEKIDQFVSNILNSIKNVSFEESRIRRIVEQMTKSISQSESAFKTAAHQAIKAKLPSLLFKIYYDKPDILPVLATIIEKNFTDFQKNLFENSILKLMQYGNVHENFALNFTICRANDFKFKLLNFSQAKKNPLVNLENNSFVQKEYNPRENDPNNAIVNYQQFGELSAEASMKIDFIETLMGNEAFFQLRDQLQLGQMAKSKIVNLNGVFGLIVAVNGNKEFPMKMDEYIENLLFRFEKNLTELSENNIKITADSLNTNLKDYFLDQSKSGDYQWRMTAAKPESFREIEDQEAMTNKINRTNIVEFQRNVLKGKKAKMSVQIFSKTLDGAAGYFESNNTLTEKYNYNGLNSTILKGKSDLNALPYYETT